MEHHLRELEAVLQAALQRFLQSARSQVQRSTEALAEERDAMLAEVEGKRADLNAEIAAMAKFHLSQESKVELNIGGTSFTTSVSTLRNKPGTMLDAMFSGRYPLIRGADGGVFIDRDGAHFGHVLSYLRDGDVGCQGLDGRALRALKREFGFYSISLLREMEYGYVVGGEDTDDATVSSVLRCDRASDAWTAVAPMRTPRETFGICQLGGLIYVAGGQNDDYDDVLSSVEVYDPLADVWSDCTPMLTVRSGHSLCASSGGSMFAIGGCDASSNLLSSVERYDAAQDRWTEVQPMPAARSSHGVCAVGDDIYVIGGLVDSVGRQATGTTASILKYSVSSNTWTEAGNMPTSRVRLGVCVLGTHIYCIGGYNGRSDLSVVERYDTESGVWRTLAPMPTARWGAAAFVLEGKIYVSGGVLGGGWNSIDVVERYDPVSGVWDTVSSLPGGRAFGAGCSVCAEVNYFDWLLCGGRD